MAGADLTTPFVRLSVRKGCLSLNVSQGKVFGLPFFRLSVEVPDTLVFSTDDASGIEPVGHIPFLSTGVRIHHTKSEYPEKVIFWCIGTLGDARDLACLLQDYGFLP